MATVTSDSLLSSTFLTQAVETLKEGAYAVGRQWKWLAAVGVVGAVSALAYALFRHFRGRREEGGEDETPTTTVDLHRRELGQVPEELFERPNIGALILDHNKLTDLPAGLSNLRRLHSLTVNFNFIPQIPQFLGRMGHLRLLQLSHNPLGEEFPRIIFSLPRLQKLHLEAVGLRSLPEDFGHKLSELEELDVSDNLLTRLPDSFNILSRLTWLDVSNNQIERFPRNLSGLLRLHTLDASGNPMDREQARRIAIQLGRLTSLGFGSTRPVGDRKHREAAPEEPGPAPADDGRSETSSARTRHRVRRRRRKNTGDSGAAGEGS